MKLSITRQKKNDVVITGNQFGTTIAFQNVTVDDHNKILVALEKFFKKQAVLGIHYDWKQVSVFIFDIEKSDYTEMDWTMLKADLRNAVQKQRFAIIADGLKEPGSQLNQIAIVESPKEKNFLIINKFDVLLNMTIGDVSE